MPDGPAGYIYRATREQARQELKDIPMQSTDAAPPPDEMAVLQELVAEQARRQAEKDLQQMENGGKINEININDTSYFLNDQFVNKSLLNELEQSDVKYNYNDIIAITKMPNNQLVWLEKGGSNAGLEHIMRHADQFVSKGIPKEKIPDFIMCAITYGTVVGKQRTRVVYEVKYDGKRRRVAITIGNNGFIVGANPKSIEE